MAEPTTVLNPQARGDAAPGRADETGMRALVEGQLALLGRLAEAGLNIALAIERQVLASETLAADTTTSETDSAPPEPSPEPVAQVVRGDVALAYGRVARAVRLTVALQGRLIKELQAQEDGARRRRLDAEEVEGRMRKAAASARKARVTRIIDRLIWTEERDEADADRLADEASERLEHDDIYGDLTARPVSELIALIAQDLGLEPDWSELACEAWAQEELAGEAAGAPLLALRPRGPPGKAPAGLKRRGAGPPPAQARAASP